MTRTGKSPRMAGMVGLGRIRIHRKKEAFLLNASALVLLAGLLTACAGANTTAPTSSRDTVQRLSAIELFSAGFTQISDKYIETVPLNQLALEGVRGLSAIDPSLTVLHDGQTIRLLSAEREIARFQTPGNAAALEPSAWAGLTADVLQAARNASASVQREKTEKIYEAVFDGMLSTLDIYSRYAGRKQAERNRDRRDGFGGIGIRFRFKRDEMQVYRVLENTPAERAGLKKGDIITHVGDVPVKGLKARDIVAQLHGPIDSLVTLTVRRADEKSPRSFEIKRSLIVPNTVTSSLKDGIAFLRIRSFNHMTAERTARRVREAQEKTGGRLKGVVLDLRGNPGGLLKQAIRIADLFLKKGSIVSTRGRHQDSYQYYEADTDDIIDGRPLAVLVDGKSASAAEVLAAALQDSGRAVIIGTTSYGKGTVQTVIRLPNNGEMTLTWSRLHSPAGYIFHNLGVLPSVCTSGQDQGAAGSIRAAIKQHARTLAALDTWRRSNGESDEKRNRLREFCPPERRRKDIETEVAARLLREPALYARTVTAAPDLARAPEAGGRELSFQPPAP
ncbi:MAG: S41 family peptidase [Rhodospirillales bacterium]